MSIFLDIDRARSVFRLLFVCSFDSVCSEQSERQFQEDLLEITQGVQIPAAALQKLRVIYFEVRASPEPVAALAAQVARDFAEQREILCSVLCIVLRIASDEGMLCATDRARVREVFRQFSIRLEELEQFSVVERVMLSSCLYGDQNSQHSESFPNDLLVHFEVLGCSPEMTGEEIRRRYRELAMKYHPDRSLVRGDANDRRSEFHRIQKAYEAIRASW